MRVAHLGHACVLLESAGTRLLVDPGTLSAGFEPLRDLDAVLITHQHADHLDLTRLPALLAANPGVRLLADPGSADSLAGLDTAVEVVTPGERVRVASMDLDVVGGVHALVHAEVPVVPNVGYLVDDGAFYHPGDSFVVPAQDVDVFGVPVSGPWLKLAEAIDFQRAVRARRSVPIHEAALADTALTYGVLGRLATGSFTVLTPGELTEV